MSQILKFVGPIKPEILSVGTGPTKTVRNTVDIVIMKIMTCNIKTVYINFTELSILRRRSRRQRQQVGIAYNMLEAADMASASPAILASRPVSLGAQRS